MIILYELVWAAWDIFIISVPYIFLGFFLAGILKVFLPDDFVSRHLGSNGFWSVIKASAIGVPIPLCSCGVFPAAAGLRKQGASKGATASFLISTPETGMDSIAITYGLLGSFFTILRPLAAFVTAATTGILINLLDHNEIPREQSLKPIDAYCNSTYECTVQQKQSFSDRFKEGMRFAFVDLVKDTGGWFMLGIVIATFITVFLSPKIVNDCFGNRYLSMILMLGISIPLYVCASSSTPIAAVFLLKDISPGAVLIFLLAGPATNAASITVISKVIGKKATGIYIFVIIAVSVIMGLLVDLWLGG